MSEKSFARIGYLNAQKEFEGKLLRAQDIVDTKGVSAEEHQTNDVIHLTPEQTARIAGAIQSSFLGAANGVATLDADGQLNPSQIDLTAYQAKVNTATYADMLALDTTVKNGCPVNNYVFVTDATGDPSVESGWAIYRRVSAGNAAADFVKTSEQESLDVVLPDFVAMNNRISANETAAAAAQSTADGAVTAAENAMTEAQLLDAAYCKDEADMATKNLRTGAVVLMEVSNDTVDA